jgi:hypothetical protein
MATLETPVEGMRQDFQAGMGLAQGFMQNYWRAKEQAVQEDRWRATQALRDVQLSEAQTRLQSVQNAATLKAQQDAAVPGLFGLASKAQLYGWNDEAKSEFLGFLSKNPALAGSEPAKQIQGMFDAAERAQREKDALDMKLENDRRVAEIREQQQARDTNPRIIENEAGDLVEVSAGGAVRPVRVWSDLEKADIDSTLESYNRVLSDSTLGSTKRAEIEQKRASYLAGKQAEAKRRTEEIKQKIRKDKTPESVSIKLEAPGWREMIRWQGKSMKGDAIPAPVSTPSTNAPAAPNPGLFKITPRK